MGQTPIQQWLIRRVRKAPAPDSAVPKRTASASGSRGPSRTKTDGAEAWGKLGERYPS
jgi:hypothetical protein